MKDMVKRWKVSVFSLQGTKVQAADRRMVVDMWGRRSFDFIHKLVVGRFDEILVAWDEKVMEVIDHRVGGYSTSILGRNKEDDFVWDFSGVYGSCDPNEFDVLREELGSVRSN